MRKHIRHIKRAIALVSDVHAGSIFAPWPDDVYTKEGNNLSLQRSPGQLQLLNNFNDFVKEAEKWRCDTVMILADVCSGANFKEGGRFQMTPDLDYQKDAAVKLLKPICKGRIVHCFSGSLYHESRDSRMHKDIAERLRICAKNVFFHDYLANIRLEGTNRIINVSHGVSGAAIYRTTIMDREGFHQLAAQGLGKLPKVDVIIRGHWHQFIHIHMNQQHMIQVPCWMAWAPWKGSLRFYGKMQPDIGGVVLTIDENDRIAVYHYFYDCPHIADMIVEG